MIVTKNKIQQVSTSQNTIAIDTAMLQSYHDASVYELTNSIKPRKNEQGELDVLILDNNNNVGLIRPNKLIDCGWEMITSNINAQSICLSPIAKGKAQRMFMANPSGGNTEIMEIDFFNNEIFYRSVCTVNRDGGNRTHLKSGLAEVNGKEEIILVLSGGLGKWSAIINVEDGSWYYTYPTGEYRRIVGNMEAFLSPLYPDKSSGVWPNISLIAGVNCSLPWVFNCYMTPNGEKGIIENHQAIGYTWVYTTMMPESAMYYNSPKEYSLVTDKNGVLNLFVLSQNMDNNNMVMLQCQFDGTNWLPASEISTVLGNEGSEIEHAPYSSLSARLNLKGEIELTMIRTTDNVLLYCSQFEDGLGNITWSSWIPISENCRTKGMGQFENGFTQIFVDGMGNDSFRSLYQTETEETDEKDQQYWTEEAIIWQTINEVGVTDELYKGQAYRTTVTMFNADGATAKNVKCSIDVSDFLPCHINSEYFELQPSKPKVFETNSLGQINIEYVLEGSIYCPSFSVTPVVGLSSIVCKPDRDTFNFLKNIIPNNLDWYNSEGVGIIPRDKNNPQTREEVAKAIKSAADMAKSYYEEYKGDTSIFAKNVNLTGIDVFEKSKVVLSNKIPFKQQNQKAGKYSVINGKPIFEEISLEDYARLKLNCLDARIDLKDRFGGFFDFFGDLWEAVKDVASSVVSIAWDGITAAVNFLVDGIHYFVEVAVETARDVFEVVGAILDQLGTIIGTVMVWVLDLLGFLFDWRKIIEMKNQVKDHVRAGFGTFTNWLVTNSPTIEQKINDLLKSLPAKLIEDKSKIAGMEIGQKKPDTYNGDARTNAFTVNGVCFWNQGTWLIDTVMSKLINSVMPNLNTSQALENLWNVLSDLINALGTTANAQIIALKDKLLSLFQKFVDNPLNILADTVDTIVSLIIDFVNTLFELVKALISIGSEFVKKATDVLTVLFSWFDQELNIPFIRTFYKTVIDSPLTLLDLFCLIVAIPASIADALIGKVQEATSEIADISKQAILGIITGVGLFISETFALMSNKEIPEKELNGFAIVANIFSAASGAIWITWDQMHMHTGYFGVAILAQSVIDSLFRLMCWKRGTTPEQYGLKYFYPFLEAMAGAANVIVGIISIATNSGTFDILMGVPSILIGVRFVISAVVDFNEAKTKTTVPYIYYVFFNSAAVLGLCVAAGKYGSIENTKQPLYPH